MILSGLEIKKQIKDKHISIIPYDESKVNPNSYNLSLHNELLIYKNSPIDMKKKNEVKKIIIPEAGLLLEPNKLYLGRTVETTFTDKFVPMIEGRSSLGRLGIFIHITAGFGDVGFNGTWTLEISCVEPVVIYPNVQVAQIYYHDIRGDFELYKSGKYQGQKEIRASKLYEELNLKSKRKICK